MAEFLKNVQPLQQDYRSRSIYDIYTYDAEYELEKCRHRCPLINYHAARKLVRRSFHLDR